MSVLTYINPTPSGPVLRLDILLLLYREGPKTLSDARKLLGALPEDRLDHHLSKLAKDGLVKLRLEPPKGVTLTAEGRNYIDELLSREVSVEESHQAPKASLQ